MWNGMANVLLCFAILLAIRPSYVRCRSTDEDGADDDDDSSPKSGDLVARVKTKLASDHRALGNVSATLLSVQTEVDQTEQSMLGKILDLQTARSFFTRHEEIDTANEKLKDEIETLNSQVEALSAKLSKVQRRFLAAAKANMKSEGKLRQQIIEDQAVIASINAELAKEDEIRAALKRLAKIHEKLLAEAVEAYKAGERAVAMLKVKRSESRLEASRHRSLRAQLVRMNNYSIACHASVDKAGKTLGMLMLAESKDSQAGAMTLRQKRKANDASEQRLLAERALLISETKRVEKEGLAEIERTKDLRDDLQILEKNIVDEIREMQAKIDAEKERVKSLSVALLENTQAEASDVTKKESVDKHLAELMKQVHDEQNPVIIATTEGQNNALRAELDEAFVMWKASKQAETAAELNAEQAAAEAVAQNQTVQIAEKAMNAAQAQGQARLAKAVKEASISRAKSQALFDKAQAAVAGRCQADWNSIWKAKRAKLVKCKSNKQELTMELARKSTLEQALRAAQTTR